MENNRTYYVVLGISRSESPTGVRAAYRDRARHLHPDIAGEHATRAFQELTEAYGVLSDPARRHAYNAQLDEDNVGRRVAPAERFVALDFEVLLTPEEAAAGCDVPIGVPTFRSCSRCRGFGRTWASPCGACRAAGMIETEWIVHVRVPPMIFPSQTYAVSLGGLGIENSQLRLHVLVER